MFTDFLCPECKSSSVLGDARTGHIVFICQKCGKQESVKHQYNVSKPYYYISSENQFIVDMLGKN
jgi:transposase-like protein